MVRKGTSFGREDELRIVARKLTLTSRLQPLYCQVSIGTSEVLALN
ncbi:hypothetical protein C5L31_002104 [Secundilactobacillus malefermentans]|uniref:Uncharacterized protein n=1 Tax=Secundilactobacillus malefermentans TaxID=176292 RepID=A0A4R5NHC4_9LACO|nr:hypothetical protein C5L31_002104 [Secundilactobacillus malefermentans]